jgi:hypothetical protein
MYYKIIIISSYADIKNKFLNNIKNIILKKNHFKKKPTNKIYHPRNHSKKTPLISGLMVKQMRGTRLDHGITRITWWSQESELGGAQVQAC